MSFFCDGILLTNNFLLLKLPLKNVYFWTFCAVCDRYHPSVIATWLSRSKANVCLLWSILKARPHSTEQAVYLSCSLRSWAAACAFAYNTLSSWNWASENIPCAYAYRKFTCSTKERELTCVWSHPIKYCEFYERTRSFITISRCQLMAIIRPTSRGDHCFCCALASKYPHAPTSSLKKCHTRDSDLFINQQLLIYVW